VSGLTRLLGRAIDRAVKRGPNPKRPSVLEVVIRGRRGRWGGEHRECDRDREREPKTTTAGTVSHDLS
jgi:hypothetical protein